MDAKVSRKSTRYQPGAIVDVLMDSITDLYPIRDPLDPNIIVDIETISGERIEALDRGMWAAFKQRGADPIDPLDGNQYEECVLGEISPVVLMTQIQTNVAAVGPGVKVEFMTSAVDGKEYLAVAVMLTNSV